MRIGSSSCPCELARHQETTTQRREIAWSFASQHPTRFAPEDRVEHASYGSAGRGRLGIRAGADDVGRERSRSPQQTPRGCSQARARYDAAADDGERARALPRVRQLRKGAALNAIQIAEVLIGASLPSSSGLPA